MRSARGGRSRSTAGAVSIVSLLLGLRPQIWLHGILRTTSIPPRVLDVDGGGAADGGQSAQAVKRQQLGEILRKQGTLESGALQRALEVQRRTGGRLGQV